MDTSTQNYEEDVQLTGFQAAPIKGEGAGVAYDSETQGFVTRYKHVVYGLGYIVTREEMEDGLYEKVSKGRVTALAAAMRNTKETVGANIYNRAFNTSYTFGDGKRMISNDHPNAIGGTFSNVADTASDLSEASIEDLNIQIMGAKGPKDLQINLMPRCLIVPRQEFYNANRILKSVLQNDTGNNAINVLKSTNALPDGIKVNHYLTDSDAFFIRTSVKNGLKCYQRRAIEFTKDNDFSTENALAKATERYSFGVTDVRAVYGNPGV